MIRNNPSLLALAGLLALTATHWTCAAQSSQRGPEKPGEKAAVTGLTPARIATEPDLAVDVVHLPDPLRWSADGARVAWMHIFRPDPKAIDPTPQQEIWTLGSQTGQEKTGGATGGDGKPVVLLTAAKVTAVLSGSDKPRHAALDDDASSSNPFLLHDFAWSPDHTHLLLLGTQSLAWLDVAAGTSRLLVTGDDTLSDAVLSPDGRTVSFVRDHKLCLVGVAGGAVRTVAGSGKADLLEGELDWPYRNSLHLDRGYAWSPDSKSLAYFQIDDRAVAKYALRDSDGEARQIVFPKAGGELPVVQIFVKQVAGAASTVSRETAAREIDLGVTKGFYIPRMQWLPDGHHLAVERLNRRQHVLELLLADTVTGKAKVILTEKDDYWINLADDLTFLKDGKRFVWSSERSGFRHLYLYDTDGQQLAQLTKGDWAVMRVHGVDEAKGVVYFTATEKSPLERHLYQVNLDGTGMTRITQAQGTHVVSLGPVASGGIEQYVDTYSSQTTPPIRKLQNLSAPEEPAGSAVAADATLPKLQPMEFLTLKMHLGAEAHAFFIRPPGFDATKKYPVIVYMAGGPDEQLVRNVWMGATGLWMQLMAQKGYLVFGLDNQATAARGHYFEEPIHLRLGGQEMADQRDGLLYLATLPYVDKARIGACGWGYGGFLAVHAILDRPVPYKAAFAGAPVVDWHFYDAFFAERYLDDTVAHADGWDASMALENNSPNFLSGALMVAQGTVDERVHIENLLTLQDRLLDAGKSAEVLLFPDRGHWIEDPPSRTVLFTRMTDFFVKNL